MFRKTLKVIAIAIGSILGFVAVAVVAVQLLLNSRVAANIVGRLASENIDADLSYSDLHVSLLRNFPHVRVTVDTLALTYPHDRHSRWDCSPEPDSLLSSGRASAADTLLSFDRFTAAVNVWKYLDGTIRLDDAALDGLALFAHQYDSTSANWNVFLSSETEENTDTASVDIPWISVGEVSIRKPRAVYTDQSDKLYLSVSFGSFRVGGEVKIGKSLVFRDTWASLDSLQASGSIPGNSLLLNLPGFAVGQSGDRFSLNLLADALLYSDSFGRVHSPLKASSRIDIIQDGETLGIGYAEADADIGVDADGVDVSLSGGASDIFGSNPFFRAKGFADVDLEKACRFVPAGTGVTAVGKAHLNIDGRASMSQIKEYTADLRADLCSDTLSVRIGDELAFAVKRFDANVSNSSTSIAGTSFHPLEGHVDAGSIRMKTDSMSVAAVGMKNSFSIAKGEYHGRPVPCISLENGTSRVMFRSGTTRAAVKDIELAAALTKRARPTVHKRRFVLDSLRKKDIPVYLTEKDWKSKDISVALDTSVSRYLRGWSPSGSISAGKGVVAIPQLPLRNRLDRLEASFTDNEVNLSELSLSSGSSDLLASGKLSGLRRFLMRGGVLKASLDVSSSRVNVPEILAALNTVKTIKVDADAETDESSYMESFAVDSQSFEDTSVDSLGLIVVPANIDAVFNLNVGKVDWTGLDIKGLKATATMKERCAQLTDAEVDTDAGRIGLDAFYSTQTKSDISAGFDLNLSDVSADRIISLVPTVDDMMPALKSFKGNLDCQLTATTKLDTMMNIIMPSLDGVLKINGKKLRVEDAGDLRKITRLLMFKNKNIGDIEDLDVSAFVHDNKVEVFPFIIGVDRYRLALCGMQGFDNSLNYHISILKTPLPIRFGLNLYGTFDNWRFSLGRAKYRDGKVPAFSQQIDTMQVNIAKSIRQIYRKGVKAVLKENSNSFESVESYKKSIGYRTPNGENEFLSIEEYCQIDSLQFEMEIAEIEAEVMEEVDQILDETFVSAEALAKEFDKMFFDKRLLRQQERSAKRDARKLERKAGKSA